MRRVLLVLAACVPLFAEPSSRTVRTDAQTGKVQAPIAFRAAGLYPEASDAVRVRVSADGLHWSEWYTAEPEEPGTGALVYFETPQRWLEIDGPAAVLFIDPGETRAKPEPRRLAVGAPPMVTREQWGCSPEDCAFRGGSPAYTTVTHLIVHHTAGANTATDWPAVVRSIWQLHVNGNGWSDIGYNYLIDPNGVLYEGRQGGPGVIGAHFSGVNSGTMGVSLMGTYSTVRPPQPMVETLEAMLAWHAQKWGLDPGAATLHRSSGLRLNVVSGHRDAGLSMQATSRTECPGNGVYVRLSEVRHEVRRILIADGATFQNEEPSCAAEAPCVWAVLTAGAREAVPVVGGSWISIYGTALADATASDTTLPVSLAGVSITVQGAAGPRTPARLLYVSPGQINALLPDGIAIGTARLTLTRGDAATVESLFWVTEAAPVILAAQNAEDFSLNAPETPVPAGSALILYATGGGSEQKEWSATVGGRSAGRIYFGPAPGFLGLSQANIAIPADLLPGPHPLVLTLRGADSAPITIYVR